MHPGRFIVTFLLLAVFLAIPHWAQAQYIRENEKGEKIIIDADGNARYFATGELVHAPADSVAAYPIVDVTIEPLDGSDVPLTESDLQQIAVRRAQLASDAKAIAQARADEARKTRERIEADLAKANGWERDQLLRSLDAAKRTERETALEALDAQSMAVRADALTAKGAYVAEHNRLQRERRAARAQRQREIAESYGNFSSYLPLTDNFLAERGEADLILRPPVRPCQFQYEGQDTETGQYRRDVEKELLFTYTDERLRAYLKDKEYMRCHGFFTSLGGYRYLKLEFSFAYPNAREAYGFIEKNSILTVRMLNGSYIKLRAGRLDRGSYDTRTQILTYQVFYPIDRSQLSILRNSEVDAMRVFWSSGYEEYPIHQMDFFRRQLSCLGE